MATYTEVQIIDGKGQISHQYAMGSMDHGLRPVDPRVVKF